MPIPLLIAGLAAAAAGAVGVGAHMDAKETNEKAQRIAEEAQELYSKHKSSLERARSRAENDLLKLGNTKKRVLDYSMNRFLNVYDKIKNITFTESIGLDEISKFEIDQQGAIEVRKMTDIYSATIKGGTVGAVGATGVMMALASSGSLTVAGAQMSMAGALVSIGEVGAAAGVAGTAIGAIATPLAAIVAPVTLFTGISASLKADENLEKANTMYAEAEAAVEKMKVSETLCGGISSRSNMFNGLIIELDRMFSESVTLLEGVIEKKNEKIFKRKLTSEDFSEGDLKLIAVTRALAGAIKAAIDTPMLTNQGKITSAAITVHTETKKCIPVFKEQLKEAQLYYAEQERNDKESNVIDNGKKEQQVSKKIERKKNSVEFESNNIVDYIRNSVAIIIALFASSIVQELFIDAHAMGLVVFSGVCVLVMNTSTESNFFRKVWIFACCGFGIGFGALFYNGYFNYSVIVDIILGIITFGLYCYFYQEKSSVKRTIARFSGCICLCMIASIILKILYEFIGLPYMFSMIIVEILYIPCAMFFSYFPEEYYNNK